MTRTGVFGGQFDPPHNGHVAVAKAAVEQLRLDRLIVVVDADPPHRAASQLAADVRGQLAEAAFADVPGAEVQVLSPANSPYAVDTLRGLAGQGELFLILGADQLENLTNWHDPTGVRELATLVVAPRLDIDSSRSGAVQLAMDPVDLSSTAVRASLAGADDVGAGLPPNVIELIRREGLYR